jgi:hypothetical protein
LRYYVVELLGKLHSSRGMAVGAPSFAEKRDF